VETAPHLFVALEDPSSGLHGGFTLPPYRPIVVVMAENQPHETSWPDHQSRGSRPRSVAPAAEYHPPAVSKPTDDPTRNLPMSKIGAPRRIIEIEPIQEPAAEPVEVPEPAEVPERV